MPRGPPTSWLHLIPHGLANDLDPTWGGWGGRFGHCKPAGELHPFFTECPWTTDTVTGADGKTHTDAFATIYRWREAFQYDFADRMDWTLSGDYASANHPPRPVVNGSSGQNPVRVQVRPGQNVTLDASRSGDPDGDSLTYTWFWYPEAGRTATATAPRVSLSRATGPTTTATLSGAGQSHVILAITDSGKGFPLTRYRRIVLTAAR